MLIFNLALHLYQFNEHILYQLHLDLSNTSVGTIAKVSFTYFIRVFNNILRSIKSVDLGSG